MDVPTPVVVLDLLPKEKTTVCVKLDDFLLMFTVTALVPFIATDEVTDDIDDALAIVSNTPLPEAVTVP